MAVVVVVDLLALAAAQRRGAADAARRATMMRGVCFFFGTSREQSAKNSPTSNATTVCTDYRTRATCKKGRGKELLTYQLITVGIDKTGW